VRCAVCDVFMPLPASATVHFVISNQASYEDGGEVCFFAVADQLPIDKQHEREDACFN
jgi:hypothetical protein